MINLASESQKPLTRLDWIIHATGFFIDAMNGGDADKTEGVNLAVTAFENGASAAHAIYQGFDLIRRRHRRNKIFLTNDLGKLS